MKTSHKSCFYIIKNFHRKKKHNFVVVFLFSVSNICTGVRIKSVEDRKALKMNSKSGEKSLDEIVFGDAANEVYDDDEMKGVNAARNCKDSESSQSEWSTRGADFSARSDWSTDRSVGHQSNMNADMDLKVDETTPSDSKCSTPRISENDIDRFLDFKRAGAKKRRCSQESDEYSAEKRNRRVSEEPRQSESYRHAFSETKRNYHAKLKLWHQGDLLQNTLDVAS